MVYGTRPLRGARLAASGVAAAADFGEWSGEQCRGLENTRTNWVVGTSKVPIYEKSAVSQWVQIGEGPRYKGRAWYQGGPGHQRGAWVSACAMCVCVRVHVGVSVCVRAPVSVRVCVCELWIGSRPFWQPIRSHFEFSQLMRCRNVTCPRANGAASNRSTGI